jgi:hypothetical protein
MQTVSAKTFAQPWRWIWLVFVIVYLYAGYSAVFDNRNPVQWLAKVPQLCNRPLWALQMLGGLAAGYLHFKGLLWAWRTISPRAQTPLRFFGGLFGLLGLGVLFEFVHDPATSFYEHLPASEMVYLGVLAVMWYLTVITIVAYSTISAHVRFLSQRCEKTV